MATPAMAPATDRVSESTQTVKIRRDTLLWAATVLLQLLMFVYSYGKLSERVDAQGRQLDHIEQRLNEITGHTNQTR